MSPRIYSQVLQSLPTALIYSEESSPFILRVVGDDDADKECQSDHATQEDEDVDVDGMDLQSHMIHLKPDTQVNL